MNRKHKQAITSLIIISTLFLLSHLLIALFPGIFEVRNSQINDLLFHLRYAVSDKEKVSPYVIHIVFNDSSYRELEITPWDRTVYGKLINISKQAGIRLLAYDVFFRDKSLPENDRLLIEATKNTGIVYYPVILYKQILAKNRETEHAAPVTEDIISQNIWHPKVIQKGVPPIAGQLDVPFKELSENAKGLGHVNIDPDKDGINRKFPLLYQYKDGYIPSLIFRMTCDFLEITDVNIEVRFGKYIVLKNAVLPGKIIKDITIPIDRKGRVIINYAAPWKDSFFEFPVKEMLKADNNSDDMLELYDKVEGSVAIISDVSARNKDIGPGIFDAAYPYGGLHVNIANMILTQNFVDKIDTLGMVLLSIILIICLWLLSIRFKPIWFLLFSLILYTLFLCFNIFLFIAFKILPHTVSSLMGFILSIIFITVYQYFIEEKEKIAYRIKSEEKEKHAKKLQELDRLKTHFVQNITHEFRTPLHLILNPINSLLQEKGKGNDEILFTIKGNAQKLLRLINNLLDLSKIESGKTELHTELQDIVIFLQAIIDSFKPLAMQKHIKVLLKSKVNTMQIYIDVEKFENIISNLISNALKFTNKGGEIEVCVSSLIPFHDKVYEWHWDRKPPEKVIKITVKDTGWGIKEKEIPCIFDRFFTKSGTGIGLSLVKEYVELHYGTINVESKFNKGTMFNMLLPTGKGHLAPDEISKTPTPLKDIIPDKPAVFPKKIKQVQKQAPIKKKKPVRDNETLYPDNPIFIIDDDEEILEDYQNSLLSNGITNVILENDSNKVMGLLVKEVISVIILDLTMPEISGNVLLKKIKQHYPEIPVIIATGIDSVDMAVDCMQNGAFDYMVKPVDATRLITNINRCLEQLDLKNENMLLLQKIESNSLENPEYFNEIITRNEKMFTLFKKIEVISKSSKPILVTGESGTGKELIARAIHKSSERKGEFITVNAAGLDDTAFSDTLFGHKKGAFTGAVNDRTGLVKKAEKGTLFLDEIGDLENESQVKLLRLLQENEYYTLGSDVMQKSMTRIVAATNVNLEEKIKQEKFRKDLAFRFGHKIHIPPLKERLDDIPFLINHFLEKSAKSMNKKKPAAPKELEILLKTYHFPGNIRELEHMVEVAVSHHTSKKLSLSSFREYIQNQTGKMNTADYNEQELENNITYSGAFPTLEKIEKYFIKEAMKKAKENKTIAAQLLGITYFALNRRLKKIDFSSGNPCS